MRSFGLDGQLWVVNTAVSRDARYYLTCLLYAVDQNYQFLSYRQWSPRSVT